MELSPTVVARLGTLEAHVLDPEVSEVLVAGPSSVWVTKHNRTERVTVRFDEGAIRSLAAGLIRSVAGKDGRPVRTGVLSPELRVSVVGTPRGERCPVVRFIRRSLPKRTLSQLAEEGVLNRDAELRLLQACRNRRSIVISGHPGSGRTDLLGALARVWREERRVAVLDAADGRLAAAEIGHVTLDPEVGAEGAAMVGAEVIVADDPPTPLWAQLVGFGRPFLTTIEASDAQAALDRIIALVLQERAETSPVAGMALVETAIGLVVEMERAHGRSAVRSIAEPAQINGQLSVRPLARPPLEAAALPMSRVPALPSRPGTPSSELRSVVAIPKDATPVQQQLPDHFGFETSDISEIKPESLMSASFVGRVPTLIGRQEEDETIPPLPPLDERTMHAEIGEMVSGEHESLTNEEIEGMLDDLDEVVHLNEDGTGPKARRRTRKVR